MIHAVVILILILAGTALAQENRHGGTLIFGTMGDPLSLDPGVVLESESAQVASNIFETLVRRDPRTNRIIPGLARSWAVSPDGKRWTFNLERNVLFHDGTPFNARAVKFSWERQLNIDHPYHRPSYGQFTFYRGVWGGYPGNILAIETPDDHTLVVKLYSRSPRFLQIISHLPFAVVSPSAVTRLGDDFGSNPCGTGPFRFAEWRHWQRIVLTRNNEYWGERPYLDRLIFEPTPGDLTRRRQIRRGRIDLMENPTRVVLDHIKSGELKHLSVRSLPSRNFSFISLNCTRYPLDRPLLRRGLSFAINRQRILRRIAESMPLADSPFNTLWDRKIAGRSYRSNPDTARALFAEAGFPRGFSLELWYPMLPRPYASSPEKIAREVARDLEEAGVQVILKGMKWETYMEKLRHGNHQAAITGYPGITGDPEMYFRQSWDRNNAVLGGTNLSFYRNDEIYSLLRRIRFSEDENTILDAFARIQEIIADDAAIIPLYHNQTLLVMNRNVMGVQSGYDGLIDFSRVWLAR